MADRLDDLRARDPIYRRHRDDAGWLDRAARLAWRRSAYETHATLGARLVELGDERGRAHLDLVLASVGDLLRPWEPRHLRGDLVPERRAIRERVRPWADALGAVEGGLIGPMGRATLWVRMVQIGWPQTWHATAPPAGVVDEHTDEREAWRTAWREAHWISQWRVDGVSWWQSPLVDGAWTGRSVRGDEVEGVTSIRLEITSTGLVQTWPAEIEAVPVRLPRLPTCPR